MKIVINSCYGGFSLSPLGVREYLKRKGKKAFFYKQIKYEHNGGSDAYQKVDYKLENSLFVYTVTKDFGKTTTSLPNDVYFSNINIERTDPDLIAVVEKLGKAANGDCASLRIIEIPDGTDWTISEYDGVETVEEKHRSWS
jgi:hypothetical protein